MARKQIFISHISKETLLAQELKHRLTTDFLGLPEIFVSSDRTTIEAGEKWLDEIEKALKAADLVLVMASRESVGRPWVNFEAGAVWLRGIPLIPVCHSGVTPASLPMPLNLLQGALLTDPDGLQKIYDAVAKQLGVASPSVDFKAMAQHFAAIVKKLEDAGTGMETVENPNILCIANAQYSQPQYQFELDIEVLERTFPGRVTVEWNCSRKRLRTLLVSKRFDIVYVVMPLHPTTGALVFSPVDTNTNEPLDADPEWLTPDRLSELLVESKTRLLVFATCRAAWPAVELAGVANVVATEQDVTGAQTSEWAECYFTHLAEGLSVFKSFELARKQVDTPMRIVRQTDLVFAPAKKD
jgi:hypothetical protein